METVPVKKTDADDYDAKLEHLVDTRGISYDDARRELGMPPYELYDVPEPVAAAVTARALKTSSMRRRRRRRGGHGPQYGEEEGVGYLDGKPPYYQPFVPLSDKQVARNARGLELVRRTLNAPKDTDDLQE